MLAFGRRTLRSIPILFAAALFAGACSHAVESPSVDSNKVQPDLVCNAQISTPVVISGEGFTPMPSKVLESKKALILPTVKLHWSSTLTSGSAGSGGAGGNAGAGGAATDASAGAGGSAATDGGAGAAGAAGAAGSAAAGGSGSATPPASSQTVTVSGDPSKANAKYLSWQSEEQMTLTVGDPGLEIGSPGIYDLSVTNPDGTHKADISQALAVVPPPSIEKLVPPALCDDQTDQDLVLQGKNFLEIGGQLPTVKLASQGGKTITCSQSGSAGEGGTASSGCTIESVGQCQDIPGRNPAARLCATARIVIKAKTLAPGKYSVTLTNPAPANCHSTEAVTLTVNPPPKVTAVNPSKVCSGGSSLDITGDNFQSGASVELRCCKSGTPDQKTGKCADGSAPSVTSSTSTSVSSATSMTADFGPGVNPGDTCNVVVINPDTCEDRPLPHQTVTGTPGPIVFYVDPFVAYNGINTQITLYMTSVTGKATVTLVPTAGCNDQPVTLTSKLDPNHANRIQATVPKGTAACVYDVKVTDQSGCAATLPAGLTVTGQLKLTQLNIDPPFGQTGTLVPVQITSSGGFTPTPRAFLNPTTGANPVAVQLEGVTRVDATKLTAVVPKNTPVGTYDLVVVNPTGEVGVQKGAYTSLANAPPDVTGITPQSVVTATGQQVTVSGTNFDSGAKVSIQCVDNAGNPVAAPAVSQGTTCSSTSCNVTLDATGTPPGAICVITVTNSDQSYSKYSALGVTGPSLNLIKPVLGKPMNVARRALLSAAVRANNASRYVYAIGGDGGSGSPFASVEFANVDLFGNMSAWTLETRPYENMATPRAFLAGTSVGRYVYAFGGTDGSKNLQSAERAMVLSPAEIPHVEDVDLCLSGGATPCWNQSGLGDGLDAGTYAYRIAATISNSDPVNLGGETLASDPQILKLPAIGTHKIAVKLTWSAPVDNQGNPLSGITGYRIYRTKKDGVPGQDEVLLDTVTNTTAPLTYIDDGSKPLGTEAPLPPGSTSAWQALPDLSAARYAAACVAAQDPGDATKSYVYALEGQGQKSYEFLTVTTQPNERQTVSGSWTPGGSAPSVGRYQFGAYTLTHQTTAVVPAGKTYVYLAGGRSGNTSTGALDVATVGTGGDLGSFATGFDDISGGDRAGYAPFAAGTGSEVSLFEFAGATVNKTGNCIQAKSDAISTTLTGQQAVKTSWNNQGLTMTTARYLPGTSIQSAFVFFTGGTSGCTGAAVKSTEFLTW